MEGGRRLTGQYEQHVDMSTEDRPGTVSTSCLQAHSFGLNLDRQPVSRDHFRFRSLGSPVTVPLKAMQQWASGPGADGALSRLEAASSGASCPLQLLSPRFLAAPTPAAGSLSCSLAP